MNIARIRLILVFVIVVASLVATIYDWARVGDILGRLSEIGWLGAVLIATEACFIIGALLMAVSAGESIAHVRHPRHWWAHMRYLRQEVKTIAGRMLSSRLFAIGFWLNFAGAVGTSLVLVFGVIHFLPHTGWGLLILIVIDLVATFGWRLPLEYHRRKARKHVSH